MECWVGGPNSRSGRFGEREKKVSRPRRDSNPAPSSLQLNHYRDWAIPVPSGSIKSKEILRVAEKKLPAQWQCNMDIHTDSATQIAYLQFLPVDRWADESWTQTRNGRFFFLYRGHPAVLLLTVNKNTYYHRMTRLASSLQCNMGD